MLSLQSSLLSSRRRITQLRYFLDIFGTRLHVNGFRKTRARSRTLLPYARVMGQLAMNAWLETACKRAITYNLLSYWRIWKLLAFARAVVVSAGVRLMPRHAANHGLYPGEHAAIISRLLQMHTNLLHMNYRWLAIQTVWSLSEKKRARHRSAHVHAQYSLTKRCRVERETPISHLMSLN